MQTDSLCCIPIRGAAVVMKPVTDWFSFVGTTDGHGWFEKFMYK
jgi:hypothetical protein